jgi:hypothetical protein
VHEGQVHRDTIKRRGCPVFNLTTGLGAAPLWCYPVGADRLVLFGLTERQIRGSPDGKDRSLWEVG